MYLETPVIAINNGGPMESICHEETGYLLPNDINEWSKILKKLDLDKNLQS